MLYYLPLVIQKQKRKLNVIIKKKGQDLLNDLSKQGDSRYFLAMINREIAMIEITYLSL